MRNKYDTLYVKNEEVKRNWLLIDANSHYLGRLASNISSILRGKHKVKYQPSVDNGDYVVLINSSKIKLSGRKAENKFHYWYTGYPGGIKSKSMGEMQKEDPNQLIKLAVKRMMPKGKLGSSMLKKLFIYTDENYEQVAQKPEKYIIK